MMIALYCTTYPLILLGGYLLTSIAKSQSSEEVLTIMIQDQENVDYASHFKGAYSWDSLGCPTAGTSRLRPLVTEPVSPVSLSSHCFRRSGHRVQHLHPPWSGFPPFELI